LAEHLLEPNYELLSAGVTNSLIYQYSRYLAGSLSYEYTKNDEISQRSNANLPDTSKNYDISSLQLNGYYNNTFGRNIHRGWAVQPSIEVSGFFGLADYKFQKLSLDVRRYTPLTKSTTLVTRVQGGKLLSVRTDSLPKHIRYYLGGTSSVRGWYRHELGPKRAITSSNGNKTTFEKYVPKGGRTFFSFNLEIRQDISPLINGFGIAAFLDGGQLWRRGIEFGERPLQFGAGGGLRYNSPIGPVRLYVGYKVNPTAKDLNRYQGHDYGNIWNRIAIHVSIGQAF
jgi:outer membrane protein insertion porin family